MTDKERITEILKAYTKKNNISASVVILEEYAEELIANGVIVPPCKVGDIVYAKWNETGKIEYWCVAQVIHNGSNNFSFNACLENEDGHLVDILEFDYVDIGKTVFLTKEEAEAKLKEIEVNNK